MSPFIATADLMMLDDEDIRQKPLVERRGAAG
jgi:ATP-dependent DNA ligase